MILVNNNIIYVDCNFTKFYSFYRTLLISTLCALYKTSEYVCEIVHWMTSMKMLGSDVQSTAGPRLILIDSTDCVINMLTTIIIEFCFE